MAAGQAPPLPIITENDVEPPHEVQAPPDPVSYKLSIDVAGGISDFLQLTLLSFSSHKELIIYRGGVEPRGIVRYIINI